MSSKNTEKKKTPPKNRAVRRERNPLGITTVHGGGESSTKSSRGNGHRADGRHVLQERNPAPTAANGENTSSEADELLLRAWEQLYAKRDSFGKFGRK